MTRRPPSSTLFPYTTLSRSELVDERPRAPIEIVDAKQPRHEPQVLLDGEVLEQMRLVGHEGEPAFRFERILHDVVAVDADRPRSEEHTSELQSQSNLVCRLL